MRAATAWALSNGVHLYVADGKGAGDFAYLDGMEGVKAIAHTFDEWLQVFEDVAELTRVKYEEVLEYEKGLREERPEIQPILFVIDEVQMMITPDGEDTKEAAKRIGTLLSILARTSRAAGVHLCLGTQRPDAKDAVPGNVKDQLGVRVGFGKVDKTSGPMVFGENWRGTQETEKEGRRPQGRGFVGKDDLVMEIQGPWLGSPREDPVAREHFPRKPGGADHAAPSSAPRTPPPVTIPDEIDALTDDLEHEVSIERPTITGEGLDPAVAGPGPSDRPAIERTGAGGAVRRRRVTKEG
jgi:hypothetical protein